MSILYNANNIFNLNANNTFSRAVQERSMDNIEFKTNWGTGTTLNIDSNLELKRQTLENFNKTHSVDLSSKSVQKSEIIPINERVKITITDPYGIRNWGARKGEHSTGIDFVTNDKWAYALNDLVIKDVKVQKVKGFVDGAIIKPSQGHSAGFYIVTENSDGTKSEYMHLNPMTKDEMESLKGKTFKRGEKIWAYNIGSGSMSGPHIKFRVWKSGQHIDPSDYVRGIK